MTGLGVEARSTRCGARGAAGKTCARRASIMTPTIATQPPSAAIAMAGMKMAHNMTARTRSTAASRRRRVVRIWIGVTRSAYSRASSGHAAASSRSARAKLE